MSRATARLPVPDPEAADRALSPRQRARLREEIRTLLAEPAVARAVAQRLAAAPGRQGAPAMPIRLADFLGRGSGAMAQALPRPSHLPPIARSLFHGL